jgi:hypothetical protein
MNLPRPITLFVPVFSLVLVISSMTLAQSTLPPETQRRVGSTLPVRQTIAVTSPAYGADIRGDTTITFTARSFAQVTVRCWKAGPGIGEDSVVGTVDIDDEGNGSIVFPAGR